MARISALELETLRTAVSVSRLVEEAGVKLLKQGASLMGLCPFHQDSTPSLSVSTEKNLFHCFGCGAAGGPIDWVMKREGVSFRHAVEIIRTGGQPCANPEPALRGTARRLAAPVRFDADDQQLLNQVIGYYHEALKQNLEALTYLKIRGLEHPELVERFKLGYANRTLGLRLPEKTRKAGSEIRTRLERIGLYRESGHEHFNGSLIVPVTDERGDVKEVYGRKITPNLRPGTPLHLYLPGPHRGVWNIPGIEAGRGEVILCEALIDAMTFWCAGFRNVTAAYGVNGFTADHLSAFRRYDVKRVLIAYDRDDAGEKATEELSARLIAEGLCCYRIEFPKTMDANLYARRVAPASKSLGVLIRKALWLGQGKAPRLTSAPVDELEAVLSAPLEPAETSLAAKEEEDSCAALLAAPPAHTFSETLREEAPEPPAPSIVSPQPPAPADDPVLSKTEQELVLMQGDRRYRVRGWMKPLNPESMRVNVLVSRGEHFHVDTFDLYNAKARASFVKQAGIELGEAEDVLKHDLGRVLLKLEALQDAELARALKKDERPALSDEEREEALALLKDPALIDRILADFAACGVVGEETNKLTGYLACVSRLLDRPLALIVQSSSAAGKSSLMDAVLALMPAEAQLRFSAMTGQSLFYMGETNLKHRILAIAEEEGVESASYALKLLQSEGAVTIASTGKDPATGLLVTHEYRAEGPVMLFLTTTAIDLDEELLNRCLVLSVNESREQTRAIHALQRRRQTLEGLLEAEDREAILRRHRNAQGLLEGLAVVNPFADSLTFLDDKTRTRRDHMKYLTLIRAIALLHQHQRRIHTVEHRGQPLRYVEVEASDIALANKLAHEVLGRTLDELPPQTRRLLEMLHAWVGGECERRATKRSDFHFTRRQVREATGWGDTQLKVHLGRLAELEYVRAHRTAAQSFEYELLYDGEGAGGERFLLGLADVHGAPKPGFDPGEGGYDANRSGQNADRSAPGRPPVGAWSGGGRGDKNEETPCGSTLSDETAAEAQKPRLLELNGPSQSYPPSLLPPPLLRSSGETGCSSGEASPHVADAETVHA